MKTTTRKHRSTRKSAPRLEAPGWNDCVRESLERLLRRGAGRGLPVVFDFDNTIVCGDIGEATLAMLARQGVLSPRRLASGVTPDFTTADGRGVSLKTALDVTAFYENFLAPTVHGASDPTPLANGYVWAAAVMAGLTVEKVTRATADVWRESVPGERRMIEVTPGRTAYPVPFFYPEMVELIACLLRCEFDVWVVSASNAWSVRWMILEALNPLLRQRGLRLGIAADHVIGVSLLMQDAQGRLYKDRRLVRENAGYARLEESVTARLRVTGQLEFPPPTYSGKVAWIWDCLGRRPLLCAGDSPGDHAMLGFSEQRLWIARLEKPDYLKATAALARKTGVAGWMFQASRGKDSPGFVAKAEELTQGAARSSSLVRASLRLLRKLTAR